MLTSGKDRDNIHYNVSEDDGYNIPIVCILSPREPGKTTSIMLDKLYSGFKKGLPSVTMVNQAADITEEYRASFEETINSFKGYEIHTKYPKHAQKNGMTTIMARFNDGEEWRPFIYIVSRNTPKTRLKRINLGRVQCLWYDECNVDVSIGEKWPDNLGSKWNELYTTLARANYPDKLHFYMTGNFYTRYNPLLIYLGVNCNKLEIGKKLVHKKIKKLASMELDFSVIVDCYQLKPELRDYILSHNPGYIFDDTYEKYFEGKAIADEGLAIEEKQPQSYKINRVFKVGQRYLYIYRKDLDVNNGTWPKYWLDVQNKRPISKTVYCTNLTDLVGNTFLSKPFKNMFDGLRYAIARNDLSFSSPEAYYLMQEIYQSI